MFLKFIKILLYYVQYKNMSIMITKVTVYFKNSKKCLQFFFNLFFQTYIYVILNGLSRKESGIGNPTFLQPN
jgi:hypothetical protein